MRRSFCLLTLLVACAAPSARPSAAPSAEASRKHAYPATRREERVETHFGVAVSDPYRYLEDATSPEVRTWLERQDAYARRTLAALPGRAQIRDRIAALSYLERIGVPRRRGKCLFYEHRAAGQEQRVLYVGDAPAAQPAAAGAQRPAAAKACRTRALVDGARLSESGTTSFKAWEPSHDGRLLAYVVHPNNADAGELRVRDVESAADREGEVIGGAKYAVPQWTPDGRGFYYVALPTDSSIAPRDLPGHAEVKLHVLGTPPTRDQVVFGKTGQPESELAAQLSHDGRWLFVYVIRGSSTVAELHVRDLRAQAGWLPLVRGHDGTLAAVAYRDRFYLRTTEGAPRGRVFRIDPQQPTRDRWQEIVPEHPTKVLEEADIVGGRLTLQYLSDGSSEIQVRQLDGRQRTGDVLALPGLGTARGVLGSPDDDVGFIDFRSFETPGSIHQVVISKRKVARWYAVPTPVDPGTIAVERVSYPSKDGTPISMFLAYPRGAPRDGSLPLLLTGYGGFNISMTPSFQPSLLAWLGAGGAVALPALRGGGERGEGWHRAGMLGNKQNVFDDFIAAAEFLIAGTYTRAERLAISGASNGGLLVGAALTQRPDLFRVVLCAVPVLDMLRYPLFGDGKTWIDEYGSPDEEPAFRALLGYSPYHHVVPNTPYPAVLLLSSRADDRVAPLHAWKMTAALQAATRSEHPVLLRIEQNAGHGGADQVKAKVEEAADSLAFALHELGAMPEATLQRSELGAAAPDLTIGGQ